MISQLISVAYKMLQRLFVPYDLRADNEERCGCTVHFEGLHYLISVLGWAIINCERYYLRRCRNVPEDIWPPTLEIAYQKIGGFVYQVQRRDQHTHDTQKDEHYRDP